MALTPIDIENQKFETRMRGYDRDQVTKFLAALAEEMTRLIGEKNRLEEELAGARKLMADSQARDRKLQDSVLALRELTEKMKEEAQREGELVVREARQKADHILHQARAESLRIEGQISQLRIERRNFEERLRMLVEEHLRLIHQHREELAGATDIPIIDKHASEAEQ